MDYVESNKVMTILVVAIVVVMLITMLTIPTVRAQRVKSDKLEAAIENDYTAYLDGNEVDISKLNTYDYVVTIDNESKSIYLTDKGFWDWGQVIRTK